MNENKIQLVALDLDGTMLDEHSKVTPRTRKAIADARCLGTQIVISTGRVLTSVPEEVMSIPEIDYIITSNGAMITRIADSKTIFEQTIGAPQVEEIVSMMRDAENYSLDALAHGDAFIDRREYEEMREHGSDFRSPDYVLATRKPVDNIFDFILENKEEMENINIVFRYLEDRAVFEKRLSQIDGITVTTSFHNNLEIGGVNTSKANALRFLMKRLKIPESSLMACGDSRNDLDMIRLARIGVVMGNASEEMKLHADHIADSNAEDGVAKSIEEFVL